MAADLAPRILDALSSVDRIFSQDVLPSIPPSSIKSAIDRLCSREMVEYQAIEEEEAQLTDEGKQIAAEGSHEAKVFEAVRQAVEGLQIDRLPVRLVLLEAFRAFMTDRRPNQLMHDISLSSPYSAKKGQRWAKERLSRKGGSRKTRMGDSLRM